MKSKTGFFQDRQGNASSSRLVSFMVICAALLYVGLMVFLCYQYPEQSVALIASSGGLFTTMTAPSFVFMYKQKQTEVKNEHQEHS